MATLGRFTVMLHQSQQQLEISTVEEPSFITILSIHNLTHCIDGALSLKVSLRLQAGLVFLPVPTLSSTSLGHQCRWSHHWQILKAQACTYLQL